MPEEMADSYWDDFSHEFPFHMLPNESDLFEYKFDLYKELVEKHGEDILNVLKSAESASVISIEWNTSFSTMENGTVALKVRDDKKERILYAVVGRHENNDYTIFNIVFPYSQFGNIPAKYMEYFSKSGKFHAVNGEFSLEFTIGCGTLADLFYGWKKIDAEEVEDASNFWKE